MPIHRINLPHTTSPLSSYHNELDDDNLLNNINSNSNSNSNSNTPPTNTTTHSHSRSISSINLLKSTTSNNNSSINSSSNVQSTISLQSMLSNQTATTEYSTNLIDNECGNLLKIRDLDISKDDITNISNRPIFTIDSNNEEKIRRTSFNFNNDSDYDSEFSSLDNDDCDYDDEDDDDDNDVYTVNEITDLNDTTVPAKKIDTSLDVCGSCSNHFQNFNNFDYNDSNKWNYKEKWAFILIGLPACGKSTMIKDFQDYVNCQTNNKVRIKSFNAGEIRRNYEISNKNKLDFNNLDSSKKLRDFYAFEALKNLSYDLINDKIDIGILDATNTTKERRDAIFKYLNLNSENNNIIINPLILEIKCSNRALRRFNIEQKSKNKDYIHMNREIAINDFLERIQNYEKLYEKVTVKEIKEANVKYFGIDNVGDTIYYDCGVKHHDNIRHQNLTFTSISLNLLYQFLVNYRLNYAVDYLTNVDHFYTAGNYHPIKTSFSKPISPEDVRDVYKVQTHQINSVTSNASISDHVIQFPKVLSSSRMDC